MKKVHLKNKNKSKKKYKFLIFTFIFICTLTVTFNYLLKKNLEIKSDILTSYLLKHSLYSYNDNKNSLKSLSKKINIIDLININYYALPKYQAKNTKKEKELKIDKEEYNPLIYIYNTHQKEEYQEIDNYNIKPTVTINNYIMQDIFEKNGLKTLVEERSITDILNLNNWNYANSYKASRILLEDIKTNYSSLKYFIDVHRDSLNHEKTTININDITYAKILFIVGLENPNYNENLTFTDTINNKINEQYPGLSKGIYKKSGPGVNGIYNQDFSPYTILIEIGGSESTIEEIMNTTSAITNIISEVIHENEV